MQTGKGKGTGGEKGTFFLVLLSCEGRNIWGSPETSCKHEKEIGGI